MLASRWPTSFPFWTQLTLIMTALDERIAANLAQVRTGMVAACAACHRDPTEVGLIAVTKYARPEWVQALIRQGVRELGENRPQQLTLRATEFADGLNWHLIGQLQRNKVRATLPLTTMIHSVDSQRLLERIDLLAGELNLQPKVLLEVNVSGEDTKAGFRPSQLLESWRQLQGCAHPQIQGLMTMAPRVEEPEQTRSVFRGLRELRDQLRDTTGDPDLLPVLSMGMSADFEVAIEEGATLIRVGSRLYQGLDGDA